MNIGVQIHYLNYIQFKFHHLICLVQNLFVKLLVYLKKKLAIFKKIIFKYLILINLSCNYTSKNTPLEISQKNQINKSSGNSY